MLVPRRLSRQFAGFVVYALPHFAGMSWDQTSRLRILRRLSIRYFEMVMAGPA